MTHSAPHRTFRALLACIAVISIAPAAAGESYRSPLALAAASGKVYVAEFTANQVTVFDPAENAVEGVIPLPGPPTGLVLAPDGGHLYVTLGGPAGQIAIVRLADRALVASLDAGHSPTAPTITPDGETLFVCNQHNNNVAAVDLAGKAAPVHIPVSREPVAAAMTPDGARLFVANLLPAGRADDNYVAATVDVIDVASRQVAGAIPLPNGSSSLLGICVSPDGLYAYVTHILSRYQLPTTQLERGWVNTNAVTIIDTTRIAAVNTVLLDDVDLGAANPWGIACTPDGQWLCVAISGTHELSILDRARLHEKLAAAEAGGERDSVPNDLSFTAELRHRVKLLGKGPRGVAALDTRVFAAEYFSGALASVDLTGDRTPRAESFLLGPEPPLTPERAGDLFFHDATVCFQQWQSCASCHPGDARVDGLNWDLLNDGMGNPKNSRSLLHAFDTPPTTVTGVRDDATMSVRSGIRFILFNQAPEEQAATVDAYLKALRPVPSPHLVNGELSPAAERGREFFDAANCANCHVPPLFTDLKTHHVGTGLGREADTAFDTPTLIEIWRTAPYLHDGRAANLMEMLTTFNRGDTHGQTSTLTPEQLQDLVEYLLSL